MEDDGDFESVMGSGPSRKEKGSNARRGHTENNLLGSSEMVAECPVDKGLPTASCSMQEEALASSVCDCIDNFSESSLLLLVELLCELSA